MGWLLESDRLQYVGVRECARFSYKRRAVVCGDVVELYTYPFNQPEKRLIKQSPGRSVEASTVEKKEKNREVSVYRAKRNLRRLVNANWNQWGCRTSFLTLTFRDDVRDLDAAHKEFDNFLHRVQRNFGAQLLNSDRLKYVGVREFQDKTRSGVIHYHLSLFNLPYIRVSKIAEVWGNGFIKLNAKDYNNLGSYMSKYLTKYLNDERIKGRKMFFRSQGLLNYRVTKKEVDIEAVLDGSQPIYSSTFKDYFAGEVLYEIFRVHKKEAGCEMGSTGAYSQTPGVDNVVITPTTKRVSVDRNNEDFREKSVVTIKLRGMDHIRRD